MVVKNPTASGADTRDSGLIPGLGRVGNGNPLQYSCLENSMGRSLAGYSQWSHKDSEMFHFQDMLGQKTSLNKFKKFEIKYLLQKQMKLEINNKENRKICELLTTIK